MLKKSLWGMGLLFLLFIGFFFNSITITEQKAQKFNRELRQSIINADLRYQSFLDNLKRFYQHSNFELQENLQLLNQIKEGLHYDLQQLDSLSFSNRQGDREYLNQCKKYLEHSLIICDTYRDIVTSTNFNTVQKNRFKQSVDEKLYPLIEQQKRITKEIQMLQKGFAIRYRLKFR